MALDHLKVGLLILAGPLLKAFYAANYVGLNEPLVLSFLGPTNSDQIVLFLKLLGDKFSWNSAQICLVFLGYFEKPLLIKKNPALAICGANFGNTRATYYSNIGSH